VGHIDEHDVLMLDMDIGILVDVTEQGSHGLGIGPVDGFLAFMEGESWIIGVVRVVSDGDRGNWVRNVRFYHRGCGGSDGSGGIGGIDGSGWLDDGGLDDGGFG